MNRSNAVVAVLLGTALATCQRAPEQTAAQPSPAPPSTSQSVPSPMLFPEPGAGQGLESEPAMRAPEPAAPAPARRQAPRASTRTRTAQGSQAPAARRSDRVERVDRLPAAEPMVADEERPRAESEPRVVARETTPERLTLPAGTELQLVLEEGLSSATSQQGDAVTARVARATGPDGRILLPGGTVLKGRVYRAEAAGRVKGRSRLSVDFDRIVVRGVEHRLDTTAIDVQGPDSHGRDAAIIGGGTVGGAIVGGILGGGKGAKKGAVIGAVGGTGAVLATRGRDVEIPSGSRWTVKVKDRVALN
jgi:type IV secretory pathway VirB10-like protein